MPDRAAKQIRLAVCDDEQYAREHIAKLTADILTEETINAAITQFDSGDALLHSVEGGAVFSILLLDVMMPDLDGMALAAALRKQDNKAAIIFISSNREMAMGGYEVQASRYLAKPVDREKLREALLYCYNTTCKQKETLLPTESGQRRVLLSDIMYAESQTHNTLLTLTTGKMTVNLMISELANMLRSDDFIFCHRTVLVNLAFVHSITRSAFELKNGESLPISKYRLSEVKARFLSHIS